VATALWVAAVLGFRYYLVVANPGGPFGVAGSVLVLLFFLYITGLILMFGGEISGVLHRHRHSRPAITTSGTQESSTEEVAGTGRFT
jgi:membrane protein